jgi:hypothetical protein
MSDDYKKDDEALESSQDQSFALNQRTFKGQKLNKFTLGHRVILNQIREDNDSIEFFVWSSIFTLLKNKEEVIDLAWNKTKFRKAVIEWVDTLRASDYDEAVNIVNSIYNEISESRVEVADRGNAEKK